MLVLLFGQRPHRIARLAVNDVDGDRVSVTLGASPIGLPEPLAGHMTTLIATRRARVGNTCLIPGGPWLCPSQHPGRRTLSETITHRLQRVGIQPTACRAALLHLAGEMPPAVLGDLLGLGRTAVRDWTTLAARPWASYISDRLAEAHDPAGTYP